MIFVFLFQLTIQIRVKIFKGLDWWIEKTDPDFRYGAGFVKFKNTVLIFFNELN